MNKRYFGLAMALLFAATVQQATAAPAAMATPTAPAQVFDPNQPIEGIWETPEKSQVTIVACAEDFCGSLTKIVVPPEEMAKLTPDQRVLVTKMDPSQFPDARNEDAALRTRSLLGLQILSAHPNDATNFKGKLYNPQDGKTYDGYVKVIDANTIEVGGCVMGYCGNPIPHQQWTRAPLEDVTVAAPVAGPGPGPGPGPGKPGKKPPADATNATAPGAFQ